MHLSTLHDQRLVNVGDDTAASNSGLDECIELLVATNSQLEMARGDAFDLEVLAGVTCKLKNLSSEVLEDRR